MSAVIDYYYAPISGFAYLGEPRLMELARQAKATILFKPVDIAAVFAAAETTPPFKQSPARLAYRFADMKRQAERRGLPLNPKPKYWPVPPALAGRIILSAQSAGYEPHIASFSLLSAIYAQDRDISDEATVLAVLNEAGLDGAGLLELAKTPEAEAAFKKITQDAIDRGVFGSPTYFLGDEMFFGQDRLGDLAWRLGVTLPQ
ncbi:MAG: 2-hydroxychromene-2-carboxylate isomerase [Pseudomonadota bacterium]